MAIFNKFQWFNVAIMSPTALYGKGIKNCYTFFRQNKDFSLSVNYQHIKKTIKIHLGLVVENRLIMKQKKYFFFCHIIKMLYICSPK